MKTDRFGLVFNNYYYLLLLLLLLSLMWCLDLDIWGSILNIPYQCLLVFLLLVSLDGSCKSVSSKILEIQKLNWDSSRQIHDCSNKICGTNVLENITEGLLVNVVYQLVSISPSPDTGLNWAQQKWFLFYYKNNDLTYNSLLVLCSKITLVII